MPAKVTLTVTEGSLIGQTFGFDERATCLIGRGKDCQLRIPTETDADRATSRHHCLVDINPPDIRIRDLGSLNGTIVNKKVIGRRKKGQDAVEGSKISFREHDLKSGDEIKVGKLGLRVEVDIPVFCAGCSQEIPQERQAQCQRAPGTFLCGYCQTQVETVKQRNRPENQCAQCGKDVVEEMGPGRQGQYICLECHEDPLQIANRLLDLARSGERELESIKDYEIGKLLGKGGMGAVYKARHKIAEQHVALKVMLPKVAANEHSRKMFLREIRNNVSLKHDHVVPLYDHGHCRGTFFLTLELCKFRSLDKLIQKQGKPLAIQQAAEITLQILRGLEYAHKADVEVELKDGSIKPAKGLVHRDLSPQNILLTGSAKSLVAKVSDFGLAKAFDTAGWSGMTRSGSSAGKPYFMPRQQVKDYMHAKPEVDVWAAAACLYYMLTGKVPRDFSAKPDPWIVVLETKPIPIQKRNPAIPGRLAKLIDDALIDDPKITFQTAVAFRQALEKVL